VSDGISVDTSALDKLAADLGQVPDGAGKRIRQAVEVGARNVKDSWRDKMRDAAYLPHASQSISYDMHGTTGSRLGAITAEIGPELGGQGSLVGGVEMGTLSGVSPRGYGLKALQDEQPDFERGLDLAIDDALKAAGL
jgi:hypothetical protein